MPEPSNLSADIATKVLEANIRNIVEKVKADPRWRISLQTHKYLNIP